jgi:hypothetical protein
MSTAFLSDKTDAFHAKTLSLAMAFFGFMKQPDAAFFKTDWTIVFDNKKAALP